MAGQANAPPAGRVGSSSKQQARQIDPQLALDIVGIFDPTGAADLASTGISLWRGEFFDAFLGAVSMVPYLGDAAAKPFKIARKYGEPAVKLVEGAVTLVRRRTDDMAAALRGINRSEVFKAREDAAKAVRDLQARKRAGCNTAECRRVRRSNMPNRGGTWDPPNARETGNGTWNFTDEAGNQHSVTFRDGYPDFSPNAVRGADGQSAYHLDNPTGNVYQDTQALFRENPQAFPLGQPDGTTLHHMEDGRVAFVDRAVHDNVSHTGFRSIQNTDVF